MLEICLDKRKQLVDFDEVNLSTKRQCELLSISRSSIYYKSKSKNQESDDLYVKEVIDKIYTDNPFYGSRRIAVMASREVNKPINRKRIQRLMREMGIAGIAPGPNTSKPNPNHKIYPYLLRGVRPTIPEHVWSTDITYIRLHKGFAYLVAVIDWYSRYVLSWRLSNTLDVGFCIDALEEALQKGKPKIFNTDQGSQFTSHEFTNILIAHGIDISMDGKGRALDNIFVERLWRSVKYEDIYIKDYSSMLDVYDGLKTYFYRYNHLRPHQSLSYQFPADVHFKKGSRENETNLN